MDKSCIVCSKVFQTKTKALTCSTECVAEGKRRKALRWAKNNREKVRLSEKKTRERRTLNGKAAAYQLSRRSSKSGYLDRFMERIKENNPSTDLTREYLSELFGETCAVTGVPFRYERTVGTAWQNPYAPSIDRIDSNLPYQQGNVQIVLAVINFAKSAMSMEDFTAVWKDITKNWKALTQ